MAVLLIQQRALFSRSDMQVWSSGATFVALHWRALYARLDIAVEDVCNGYTEEASPNGKPTLGMALTGRITLRKWCRNDWDLARLRLQSRPFVTPWLCSWWWLCSCCIALQSRRQNTHKRTPVRPRTRAPLLPAHAPAWFSSQSCHGSVAAQLKRKQAPPG